MEKDLKGSGCGLIQVLSSHMPGESNKNHKKKTVRTASVPAKIQTDHLLNTMFSQIT
jgi:hypothetical protein